MLNALRNCREATMLLEQRQAHPLGLTARLRLWAHLAGCVYCRRYARQTVLLGRAARLTAERTAAEPLSPERKAQWRELLRSRM